MGTLKGDYLVCLLDGSGGGPVLGLYSLALGAPPPQRQRTSHSGCLPSAVIPIVLLVWSTACEGPHCCCCRLRLWSGSSPSPPSSAASPHLCQPEAKAAEAQGLALVASGQWGSKGQGRALIYKGVIVAQASIPRWGTLAHPHPKVTATSFLSLSCSEGKMRGLGCGRGKNSKGPAGWGWCHHVS